MRRETAMKRPGWVPHAIFSRSCLDEFIELGGIFREMLSEGR